jgi:hypothetical protein
MFARLHTRLPAAMLLFVTGVGLRPGIALTVRVGQALTVMIVLAAVWPGDAVTQPRCRAPRVPGRLAGPNAVIDRRRTPVRGWPRARSGSTVPNAMRLCFAVGGPTGPLPRKRSPPPPPFPSIKRRAACSFVVVLRLCKNACCRSPQNRPAPPRGAVAWYVFTHYRTGGMYRGTIGMLLYA